MRTRVFVCPEQMIRMGCKASLTNMPLAIGFLLQHTYTFSEQTNYVKQKIDGLWKFSREHKRRAAEQRDGSFFIAGTAAL